MKNYQNNYARKIRGLNMGFIKLLVAIGAAAYGISPVDIIPDVVPVVGWADDVGVILAALAIIAKA